MQKVWFRKSKNAWFATIFEAGQQKQIRLVNAPNDRDGKKLAEAQLLVELTARNYKPDPDSPETDAQVPRCLSVGRILAAFLKHSREEHESTTADWYEDLLQSFTARWGKLRYTRLRKKHVRSWLAKSGYNPTSANKALGAVKRAFNWAVEEELIPKSPIAHLRKPRPVTRDRVLSAEERLLILSSIKDAAFRHFVNAMTLTGCRPGEIARVTAEHVDLTAGVWTFHKHKTAKKTGKPRVVYLPPEALEMSRVLVAAHHEGPLFRNTRGVQWTRNAVRIRFRRLRKKFPQLKGVVAYTYRSSYATDALASGVQDATVAALLGHTNTDTLHRFYARLSHKTGHLKDAAEKATRPAADVGPGGIPG